MNKMYMQSYIDATVEFRNSNKSEESIEKLYKLMRELESATRTKNNNLLLSNIYTLLGYHQSAYNLFKTIADESNRKDSTKLQVMKNKAESYGDNFGTRRDVQPRTLEGVMNEVFTSKIYSEEKKEGIKTKALRPLPSGFRISKEDEETYVISSREVAIFNKKPKENKILVNIPIDESIDNLLDKIKEHLEWLGNCNKELLDFYNSQQPEETSTEWYNLLEIAKVLMIVDEKGNVFTSISCDDKMREGSILDIEIDNRQIISMNYER